MAKTVSTQQLETVFKTVSHAADAGLINLTVDDQMANGRTIHLKGKELVNFGSCSYLGIELDERLKQGAIEAIHRYGTQFASSRAYLSIPMYEEIEDLLYEIFQVPLILAPTLTLGHQSNIPILVGDEDAVILDHQVHNSIQSAVHPLRMRGIHIEMIRHNRMDMLENRIQKLSKKYKKIWYMADGIYSMYGDFAPVPALKSLLDAYEQFHLYIDDAHGSGCMGKNGGGFVHEIIPQHDRMYLSASLAKSFATAGGVLTYPNKAIRDKIRRCGRTMIFSGPIQPPLLGAIMASIRLHLSDELPILQQKLRNRIKHFNFLAQERDIPLGHVADTPICYVTLGKPENAYAMVQKLMDRGYFTNLAVYPSVPYNKSGLRIAINNHLSLADISGLLDVIQEELPKPIEQAESKFYPGPSLVPGKPSSRIQVVQ